MNDAQVTIAQAAACRFTVAPQTATAPAAGGNTTLAVTANGACGWTASSQADWIRITSGSNGSDSGSVTLAVSANNGAPRTGTAIVAGQTISVSQGAVGAVPPDCGATLNSTAQAFDAAGGSGSVSVAVAAGCAWTAAAAASWITVTGGASRTGSGVVMFAVAANGGAARTGTVAIAGQTFTVTQAAPMTSPTPCSYAIRPTSQSFAATGGSGSVSITAGNGCSWRAASMANWITIAEGAAGAGNGVVSFTVVANSGAPRSGTLTIAGQTFNVMQAAPPCSYEISPQSATFSTAGGTGTVNVTTTSACSWKASEHEKWLQIDSGASGTGSGSVQYTVQEGKPRTGTMTIAGQTFAITQTKGDNEQSGLAALEARLAVGWLWRDDRSVGAARHATCDSVSKVNVSDHSSRNATSGSTHVAR